MNPRKAPTQLPESVGSRRGPRAPRGAAAYAILTAARSRFASAGYAGTTIRSVALEAGVDAALVTYYFRDKASLLAAATELPAEFLEAAAAAGAAPLRRRGRALMEAMVAQWEMPTTADVLRSAMLSAAHVPAAMQRLRTVFADNLLVAVSDNLQDERFIRAGLVASQMIGVAITRYVWRVGTLAELQPDEVVRYVAPTIQRYLSGRL